MKTFTPEQIETAVADLRITLGDRFVDAEQVGSSYILGEGEDLDSVALVKDPLGEAKEAMLLYYTPSTDGSGNPEDDEFQCFRDDDDVNVMITTCTEWFESFIRSAEVCKALGLKEKWQRITVHRVLMDEEDAETAVRKAKEVAI